MAKEFIALNEDDSRELRKNLGLPIFKSLRYMEKTETSEWKEIAVTGYKIVDTYQPSGTHSFLISLENGKEIRILQDYFVEMQKPSFIDDMSKQNNG